MYQFSRAIYRELAPHLLAPKPDIAANANHEHLLQACEAVVERMAVERLYFARPERTLFCDIRSLFPMSEQGHVHRVVCPLHRPGAAVPGREPARGLRLDQRRRRPSAARPHAKAPPASACRCRTTAIALPTSTSPTPRIGSCRWRPE